MKYIESLGIKVHKQSNELHEIQVPGPEQPKAKLVLDLAERLATSTLTELNQVETKTAHASVLQSDGRAAGASQLNASVHYHSPAAAQDGSAPSPKSQILPHLPIDSYQVILLSQ